MMCNIIHGKNVKIYIKIYINMSLIKEMGQINPLGGPMALMDP